MATGPSTPSATNAFIPNYEASGRLAVGFSRNAKRFKLLEYVKMIKSPKIRGYYLKFTNQVAGRVINQNRYNWSWGTPAPTPLEQETFNWIEFNLLRNAYPYGIDWKTRQQADFDVWKVEQDNKATLAMTARVMRSITTLTTASNWQTAADPDISANHTDTATNLGGAKLDAGTSAAPSLQKALNAVMRLIMLDTMGAIPSDPSLFKVVFNPVTASAIVQSAEYHDYLKSSPDAYAAVTGRLHPNSIYGLPPTLYGVPLVVEDTVKVTSERGATLARSFAFPDNTVLFTAREGSLEGVYGENGFNTFCIFHDRDLEVSQFDDPRNELTEGRVVEETAEVLTCPASGYLITSATN
jgi:hypothetical protein